MIDIKFLRENPEVVKENIRKKFQDEKLSLVDEVIALDAESRKAKQEADDLRASRNRISKEIGALMGQGKKEEAEAKKAEVAAGAKRLAELEASETELQEKITKIMMVIPNIIDLQGRLTGHNCTGDSANSAAHHQDLGAMLAHFELCLCSKATDIRHHFVHFHKYLSFLSCSVQPASAGGARKHRILNQHIRHSYCTNHTCYR